MIWLSPAFLWMLSTHEMASYELFLSKLTTSWCKLFLLFEKILKQQTMSEKTFYICRHAFIKDLKMNCIHTVRYFKFKYRCRNLFLQLWKLLRILQNNVFIIKSMAETTMAELVYGRIGIWTNWFMANLVEIRILKKLKFRNPNLNEISLWPNRLESWFFKVGN